MTFEYKGHRRTVFRMNKLKKYCSDVQLPKNLLENEIQEVKTTEETLKG